MSAELFFDVIFFPFLHSPDSPFSSPPPPPPPPLPPPHVQAVDMSRKKVGPRIRETWNSESVQQPWSKLLFFHVHHFPYPESEDGTTCIADHAWHRAGAQQMVATAEPGECPEGEEA